MLADKETGSSINALEVIVPEKEVEPPIPTAEVMTYDKEIEPPVLVSDAVTLEAGASVRRTLWSQQSNPCF